MDRLARLALTAWLALAAANAQSVSFRVSEAVVRLPETTAFLDIRDKDGAEAAGVSPAQLSAVLKGQPLQATSTEPFARTGQGVAYIIVLDASGSIQPQRFDRIRAALTAFVRNAGPKDSIALLAFADSVRTISDFTPDRDTIASGLKSLSLSGKNSLLHVALFQAFEMGARNDADLPLRRAIIVVSDGKDEGSGLAPEDVLDKARTAHIPIFAAGYSVLPAGERRRYLDVLHRFALMSGGDYVEPADDGLAGGLDSIRTAVTRVYTAKFQCAGCSGDGSRYHLEIQFNAKGKSFTDGLDVPVAFASRLLPPPQPRRVSWWTKWRWYVLGGAVLVMLLTVLLVRRSSRRKNIEVAHEPPVNSGNPLPFGLSAHADPGMPSTVAAVETGPSLALKLTALRGPKRGLTHELRMRLMTERGGQTGQVALGRKPENDLAFPDDSSVSSQHCILIWNGSRLIVRDMGSSNGTYVNGVRLAGDLPVESGDVIAIGQSEYRLTVPHQSI